MYQKFAFIWLFQVAIVHVAHSQSLNRLLPGCGSNFLPVAETVLPNQLLYPPSYITPNVIDYPYEILPGPLLPNVLQGPGLPNIVQSLPNVVQTLPNVVQTLPNVVQGVPQTTIIQDSTVANNLANALQLLVVSNLLSNTLPHTNEVVIPGYPGVELVSPLASMGPCGFGSLGGYNYLY